MERSKLIFVDASIDQTESNTECEEEDMNDNLLSKGVVFFRSLRFRFNTVLQIDGLTAREDQRLKHKDAKPAQVSRATNDAVGAHFGRESLVRPIAILFEI